MSEHKASLDSVHQLANALPDPDPQETREWLDSLDDLIKERGSERTRDLLLRMLSAAIVPLDTFIAGESRFIMRLNRVSERRIQVSRHRHVLFTCR